MHPPAGTRTVRVLNLTPPLARGFLAGWLFTLLSLLAPASRADDGHEIEGAFGLAFDSLADTLLGASMDGSPVPISLYDIAAGKTATRDGSTFPEVARLGWHYFSPAVLPPRLEGRGMRFFALTTSSGELVMIAALLPDHCGELSAFFTASITRKYELATEDVTPEAATLAAFSDIQRWSSRGRHIVLACGEVTYLLYGDTARLEAWHEDLRDKGRSLAEAERLRLIAETLRLLPGDQQRVHGAFGLLFARPVSGHENMAKETTTTWTGGALPAPYDKATYEVVLDPQGYPARIAGSFAGADFDFLKSALEARFGLPGKSTPTHVIHKVGGDFVTLRRQAVGVRLVVIDHETDQLLRSRAKSRAEQTWREQTEGL